MTRRKEIKSLLSKQEMSAKELAEFFNVDVKIIVEDLKHVAKSVKLRIIPAQCKECGFVFKEREKIKKPNKCPKCKSERIYEPRFKI